VEVLAGVAARHDRELRRLEAELALAACLEEGHEPERLHRRSEVDEHLRIADCPDDAPGHVDLDDIAPVDALLDAVADLANEHRRRDPTRSDGRATGASGEGRGAHVTMLGCAAQ